MTLETILAEVAAERTRQDAQWGGAAHDDAMRMDAFVQLINDYVGWARVKAREGSSVEARQRLVQVAALAVAAAQSLDRGGQARAPVTPPPEGLKWE